MSGMQRIAVIGAGAFGTALAAVVAQTGRAQALLIGRDASVMADLAANRMHEAALPGIQLPASLSFSARAEDLGEADIVLFAMPSQAQIAAAETYGPHLKPGVPVVICAKGIEKQSSRLLTDVLEAALPGHILKYDTQNGSEVKLLLCKLITHTAYRVEVLRAGWVLLEILTERHNEVIDGTRGRVYIVAPYKAQYIVPTNYGIFLAYQ